MKVSRGTIKDCAIYFDQIDVFVAGLHHHGNYLPYCMCLFERIEKIEKTAMTFVEFQKAKMPFILQNFHTHIYIHTHIYTHIHIYERELLIIFCISLIASYSRKNKLSNISFFFLLLHPLKNSNYFEKLTVWIRAYRHYNGSVNK